MSSVVVTQSTGAGCVVVVVELTATATVGADGAVPFCLEPVTVDVVVELGAVRVVAVRCDALVVPFVPALGCDGDVATTAAALGAIDPTGAVVEEAVVASVDGGAGGTGPDETSWTDRALS